MLVFRFQYSISQPQRHRGFSYMECSGILRARILQRTKGKKLWMNAYSYEQFAAESAPHIVVSQQFLHEAAAGDYCFVETCHLKAVESRIEAVIVYRWNRSYPTDFRLALGQI